MGNDNCFIPNDDEIATRVSLLTEYSKQSKVEDLFPRWKSARRDLSLMVDCLGDIISVVDPDSTGNYLFTWDFLDTEASDRFHNICNYAIPLDYAEEVMSILSEISELYIPPIETLERIRGDYAHSNLIEDVTNCAINKQLGILIKNGAPHPRTSLRNAFGLGVLN